jgi:hypothetical protein
MIPGTTHDMNTMTCISACRSASGAAWSARRWSSPANSCTHRRRFTRWCATDWAICHEDLDTLAAPHVVPFVAAAVAVSRERYSKSIGEARLMIGNVIRLMARAPKSRAGCHFAAAIGLRSLLEGFTSTIPDWANDQHTLAAQAGPSSRSFPKRGRKRTILRSFI